jgi:hypothetical protein
MVGSKSQPEQAHYDVFRCLLCSTVINLSGVPTAADPMKK